MKKIFAVLLIVYIAVLTFIGVGCKDDNPVDEVKRIFITFDANGYDCTVPEGFEIEVGQSIDITVPESDNIPDGKSLGWFIDKDCTERFVPNGNYDEDLTLYLGLYPNTYSISYKNADKYRFNGELPDSYVYGEGVILPQASLGKGYKEDGNWYYSESEYFTTAVSKEFFGNLTLEYRPQPIKYTIAYMNCKDADNLNIQVYDVTMGSVELLPAICEGKVFSHWEYRSSLSPSKICTSIDIDLILEGGMSFSLWAVWQE